MGRRFNQSPNRMFRLDGKQREKMQIGQDKYKRNRPISISIRIGDPLNYFSFEPMLHNWYNKDCGMCYPVCGITANWKEKHSMVLYYMSDAT